MSRSLPAWVLAASVAGLDQATKAAALARLDWDRPAEIIPGLFSLTLVVNTGAAWGLFRDKGYWLTLLAILALILLVAVRRHFTHFGPLPRIALGLLCGGILGNLFDRVFRGHVVDFLSFRYRGFEWPAFNVADSAICIGVTFYLLDSFLRGDPVEKPDGAKVPPPSTASPEKPAA